MLLTCLFLYLVLANEDKLAPVGSNGLPNCQNPGGTLPYDCQLYCQDCKGVNPITPGSQIASAISSAVAGANVFRDYVMTLKTDSGWCKSNGPCANWVACVSGVVSTIDKLINEWKAGNYANLQLLIQTFCTVASCAKASGFPTDKIPFFGAFTTACAVGQWGAKQIVCRDYSIGALGMMGLPTACRQALINGQPIVLQPCQFTITVPACTRNAQGVLVPRDYDVIQRDCVSAVTSTTRVPRVPQLQLGTCAYKCIQLTFNVSQSCFTPVNPPTNNNPPPGMPSFSRTPSFNNPPGQPSFSRTPSFNNPPGQPSFSRTPVRFDNQPPGMPNPSNRPG